MSALSFFNIRSMVYQYRKPFLLLVIAWMLGSAWWLRSNLRSTWQRIFFQSRKSVLTKKPIKKKLLTISLDKIILWNPSRDPAVPNYAFVEAVVPQLRKLCEKYDIYLIATASNPKEQAQIEHLIYTSDLARRNELDIRKVVFCQTPEGRSHIVRHIEPHVHVDSEAAVVNLLRLSISRLILILTNSSSNPSSPAPSLPTFPKNVQVCLNFSDASLA